MSWKVDKQQVRAIAAEELSEQELKAFEFAISSKDEQSYVLFEGMWWFVTGVDDRDEVRTFTVWRAYRD